MYQTLAVAQRGPHLIRCKCPWKWQKGNLHKQQCKRNVLRVKIQIYFHDFLNIYHEERCTVVYLPFCHFHGHLPRI